jgi:hypothetical protein
VFEPSCVQERGHEQRSFLFTLNMCCVDKCLTILKNNAMVKKLQFKLVSDKLQRCLDWIVPRLSMLRNIQEHMITFNEYKQ